ncbi:phage tail protein [Trinickia acidisoli]|uniref:phage tail protein n=1 Tax=Trinickia acidisoli TaxID=2767482 RepID=UPI001A90B9C0|nr:tail fiber protein [Trinickia acidisoli]
MSDPYIGEIRMVSFKFAPYGWALCQGQSIQVSQNQALYALIGNLYGGTAPVNFQLPNFSGRSPVGTGTGQNLTPMSLADTGGAEDVQLTTPQMPLHNHTAAISASGSSVQIGIPATTASTNLQAAPGTNTVLAAGMASAHPTTQYSTDTPNTTLAPFDAPAKISVNSLTIGNTGGNTPVDVRNPYLATNFVIALTGIYPTPD